MNTYSIILNFKFFPNNNQFVYWLHIVCGQEIIIKIIIKIKINALIRKSKYKSYKTILI